MPKRAKNPKSMRTAIKYGWHVVNIKRQEKLSWMGIIISVDKMAKGRYVRAYNNSGGGTMAFENTHDALWVSLRFG